MSDTLKFALSKCDKPESSVELNRAEVQYIVNEIAELETDVSTARQSLYEVVGQRNDALKRIAELERSLPGVGNSE